MPFGRSCHRVQGFNTQPPEGGWVYITPKLCLKQGFQHTAARRRLEMGEMAKQLAEMFQHTAARRRLEI